MSKTSIAVNLLILVFAATFTGCSDSDSPAGPRGKDTTPPAPVADATLTAAADGAEIRLEWTAPCDDTPTEGVAGYEIRLAYTSGYDPEDFWETATPVSDPPIPSGPGMRDHYTITDPRRTRDLYVGIRSIDEGGNFSLPSGLATIHVPGYTFAANCIDVFTKLPVEGLGVTLSTGSAFHYVTDASGEITHDGELDGGVTHIEILTESSPSPYHALNQSFVLGGDSVHTFLMIPVETVNASWVPNLLALFKRMADIVSPVGVDAGLSPVPQILAKWHHRPVAVYAPPFTNSQGVDYEEQVKLAAARWMERTGEPLFEFVESPPDTGIIVTYKTRVEMGSGLGFTMLTRGDDGHPLRSDVWIVDDASDVISVYMILLHELGHTLCLGHVEDSAFLMFVGQPIPGDICDDEVRVVQLLESLPTRVDMSIYDENSPGMK